MIITKQKPNLLKYVENYDRIFIIGCGECATVCKTGGEEQVEALSKILGDRVIGKIVIESPCNVKFLKKDLKPSLYEGAKAILALCCGIGAQTIAEFTNKEIIAGLDTLFMGEVGMKGKFYEKCRACGLCILYETGGICPISRCAKKLLNGPCGGMVDEKCEVSNYSKDCAWVLIYKRLKKLGRESELEKIREARDWSTISQPGEITLGD
ncbi:MAG: methylenetetrahydrofolate reductase C-terminal domain-containing protein [Candidatus Methanomethyliaceae archaeon]|nr:methylenetetrahydrofolate reductase C-terminal domain-containing protein [Candidatus Methanomethyliaceae archaeon]MCX8170164.1 methylenetetrahydrofolate reductase C-terminal domain-containing protein [Candidatus Methanomethyliaceae archaeon]MDW7970607.1 methylenetetrahydrofolate reductase C-terminal domain-containing protein [Nitrososphaerota archaeon]